MNSPPPREPRPRLVDSESAAALLGWVLGLGLIAILVAAVVVFSGSLPEIFQDANQGTTANP